MVAWSRSRAAWTSSGVMVVGRPLEWDLGRGAPGGHETDGHQRRRVGPGHAALPVNQNEPAVAMPFLHENAQRHLAGMTGIVHGLEDLKRSPRERHPEAGLTVAGAGDAAERALGIGAAADQRRIADAA